MRLSLSSNNISLIYPRTVKPFIAMAKTRGDSGITVPRALFTIPTASSKPATKKKTSATTKKPATAPKANTSKPRVKEATATKNKTTTGRVSKAAVAPKAKKAAPATKRAPKTTNNREVSLLDKVQGVAEKIAGVVQGKPGKKAAGTKKMKGTDGKGATRAKKA
ncbi:MAG: hypothetical protein L6R41_006118 [Letrouitia leprolyta]|nr:MAG: hypothetical protein L6R41_006118 [Letrouitia leprolyta]